MVTLDTSAVIILLRPHDRSYGAFRAIVDNLPGPLIIPIAILSEIMYMLETFVPARVVDAFVEDLIAGEYELDWEENDLERVLHLTRRYRDLPLGFSDASVIACAERHGGQILTTDRRDFTVVARGEKTIALLPALE